MSVSNLHIDYLTRSFLEVKGLAEVQTVKPDQRGIGFIKVSSIPRSSERRDKVVLNSRELMKDIILGMKGMMIPLFYVLLGERDKISIFIGTYVSTDNQKDFKPGIDSLESVFISAYPGMEFEKEAEAGGSGARTRIFQSCEIATKLTNLSHTAIITGLPTAKVVEDHSEVEQLDRLVRGLYGHEWAYIQAAEPVNPQVVNEAYNQVLMEFKNIIDAEARVNVKNPVADRYKELLEKYVKKLEEAKAQGGWQVCSYLSCSDQTALSKGCGITESVFGGKDSVLDPVRTIIVNKAMLTANPFSQIITPAPRGPGNVQHKYKYMTLIPSPDLATLIHLPTLEMPGFWVKSYTRFDVYPQTKKPPLIEVGEVLDEARLMGSRYQVSQGDLNKHCLIVGTTGSGKTNTVFYLIKQLWKMGIPFLVVEPAKTEYRKLLGSHEMGNEMRVFTLGDEGTSPYRLNPFEILPGVSLQTHIDHLKSVFGASFPMWAPMPQVLERAIHEIYEDKGWLLVENVNQRGMSPDAFPTLTDLYTKVEQVVRSLGYEERVTMDVQAALKTRIDSLRIGGKGLMMDVRKGVPFTRLMERPTIIELEAVSDDDEKAMLMGLILVFLQEYYQSQGLKEGTPLRHITIVEEAHRLLSNVGKGLESEVANTRWKAVETFTNMLSELRAYGEGFIIAEQIPTKLAPDVIKNTNTKIMHRIVSDEDRRAIGGSMNLEESGSKKVTSITAGQALIFGEGDDSPYQIKVPYAKISYDKEVKSDRDTIAEHMKDFRKEMPDVYTPFDNCLKYCKSICSYRNRGRKVVEDPAFQETMNRFVLTTIEDPGSFFQGFSELKNRCRETWGVEDPFGIHLCILIQASHRYFERTGANYRWSYGDTSTQKDLLTRALYTTIRHDQELNKEAANQQEADFIESLSKDIDSLQKLYKESTSGKQPYTEQCTRICEDGTCLYRFSVKELLLKPAYKERIIKAIENSDAEEIASISFAEASRAARRIVMTGEDVNIVGRAAFCYLLHTAIEIWPNEFYEVGRFMDRILGEEGEAVTSGGG